MLLKKLPVFNVAKYCNSENQSDPRANGIIFPTAIQLKLVRSVPLVSFFYLTNMNKI